MRQMQKPTVVVTRCQDYERKKVGEGLQRHFELNGGLEKFVSRGDSVLIKPNFIAPRSASHATQTHPAVIIELAKLLKDLGAKPFVGDSPAWSNVHTCARKLRLTEVLKKMDVPIKELNRARKCRIGNTKVGISSAALDADVIINLPKFKTHQQLVATFAVKNMFGVVSGKRKAICHFTKGKVEADFCGLLIDIYKFMKPAITIIDGIYAMDGGGPIRGRTRPLGWLISGTEPIAIERVCCRLINIEPESIPIIRTAKEKGFGVLGLDEVNILGDDFPEKICYDFSIPKLIPIRFSFLHVCRSITKQIGLLIKAKAGTDRGDK